LLCGLAEWQSQPASGEAPPGDRLAGIPTQKPHELLARAFALSGAPLELSAVVDAAATAWAIPLSQHDANQAIDRIPDRRPRPDAALDQRGRLERIWSQICDLPLRQRHALLLNLKDDAITVFLTSGAVSLRDVASCLELSVEDFAALWNDLPLPDNTVADRLGCTRQQVINLRMSARKRLANRLSPVANIGPGRAL
jgi:hypothetical protein